MDGNDQSHGSVVVWLDDVRAGDASHVGSKAATLGELRARGFDVPTAFVVTADTYRTVVDSAGIGPVLSYPVALCPDTRAEGRFRAGLVAQVAVPHEVVEAIAGAYRELGQRLQRPEPAVAVRASVVGEEATFGPTAPALTGVAGFDTVVKAVETCWGALFNEQAMISRAAIGEPVELAMAVIVQALAPTARAGTAYTTDPVRHRDDLVRITAVHADAVGARRLRPSADVYLVTRRSHELVELRVAEKETGLARFGRVLTDDEASLVAATALQVEACVGRPAAVDWSLTPDGRIIVLKAEATRHARDELGRAG
jgi:pyruvate,water dikinase